MAAALVATVTVSLLAACGSGGTATEQANGVSKRRGGGLGQAAAEIEPEVAADSSTTSTAAPGDTTPPASEETTSTTAAATTTATTPRPTVTQAPVTQPPVTQPPVTNPPVTNPPANNDPTPSISASVVGGAGPNCGTHTVNLTWNSNASPVRMTGSNGTSETLGASGSKEVAYSGPSSTYNFVVSNSRGSANATVTASGC